MPFATTLRRAGASALAIGVLTSSAMLAATVSASAATGQLTVCSQGDYDSFVEFPARGGMTTVIVDSGHCMDFDFGDSNASEPINVFGLQDPAQFWIGSGSFRPSEGGTVTTHGSSAHPWASIPDA
ncbi:hypothetical protein ABT324_06935 [Saccharopolyspora sp. NPDC000359]|uniref:hypothetical protein n=1 Tax=Saccharopolyspora sp. NPDC000359 TaxID=3154251 RepID=UPI0033247A5A